MSAQFPNTCGSGADRFNNSQQTRGFPDISANGANYGKYTRPRKVMFNLTHSSVIAIDGTFGLVFGTSASSPTLGSILTLINQARFDIGKGSIGFINPTAYAHPGVFNDITQGGNQGCGTPGFSSAPGWDPVTGLGVSDRFLLQCRSNHANGNDRLQTFPSCCSYS